MAPGDRGLVVEVAAGLLGGLVDRRPVLGEQRLVGGHDAGAVLQRGEDQRPGRLDAADDLDDDVHVVAGDQRGGVGGEQPVGHVDLAGRVEAAYGDADQLDRLADPRLEVAGLLLQEADHLRSRPTRSRARPPSRSLLSHSGTPMSVANRSSSVSRRTSTRATPSRTATTGGRSAWL